MAKTKMKPEDFEKWVGKEIPKECEKLFKGLIKRYTAKTAQTAIDNAPIDTGYLAGSINYRFEANGWTGVVYVGAEYAEYVEFGTTQQFAKPFLYPAYDKWMERYLKTMADAFGKAFD